MSQRLVAAFMMVLGLAHSVDAMVICARSSGRLVLRESCRPRERALPIAIENDGRLVVIAGANLQVVNGSGQTGGTPNGLGNLVVGYDGDDDVVPNARSGSHNVIVGDDHSYTSHSGLIAGRSNAIHAPNASAAGQFNTVTGAFGAICGGGENRADGPRAVVAGGTGNTAGGDYATVGGGRGNVALGFAAAIGGGDANGADGGFSVVAGGRENTAGAPGSVVSGGFGRSAAGENDWVAGSLLEDE
jgi:hypothetical protein